VRRLAGELLKRRPGFTSALNNLAESCFHEGNIDEALAATRRAVELKPELVHAQGNLTRYLFLTGHETEAREAAQRLRAMPIQRGDNYVKKAESFSFLGDDQGVIDAWRGAEGGGFQIVPQELALLHHLAAVAFCRQGNEAEARRLWRQSLNVRPGFFLAVQNLRDLDLPVGEKNGPWAYGLEYWLSERVREKLANLDSGSDERSRRQLALLLQEHPEIVRLIPHLIDRGDPIGRELAMRLSAAAKTPELLAILRDFALGQRGSDKLRLDAAMAGVRVGALPSGQVRMWNRGQWREQLLLGFDITYEPIRKTARPPAIDRLAQEAMEALSAGDGWRAERLLREGLEQDPQALDLRNNLAQAYLMQGRPDVAEAMIRSLHEKNPEYLFAAVEVARMHIRDGELDRATELLQPFLLRPVLHVTELEALAIAHFELALAGKQPEAARSWLGMMERASPHNPQLEVLRQRLAGHGRTWRSWRPW
jgi:tetratricopeptide (TPR) repeat protein